MLLLPEGDRDLIPDGRDWRRASHEGRLMLIADWLRAECYAAMERGRTPVPCPRPMQTVGTND